MYPPFPLHFPFISPSFPLHFPSIFPTVKHSDYSSYKHTIFVYWLILFTWLTMFVYWCLTHNVYLCLFTYSVYVSYNVCFTYKIVYLQCLYLPACLDIKQEYLDITARGVNLLCSAINNVWVEFSSDCGHPQRIKYMLSHVLKVTFPRNLLYNSTNESPSVSRVVKIRTWLVNSTWIWLHCCCCCLFVVVVCLLVCCYIIVIDSPGLDTRSSWEKSLMESCIEL